jgi:hypothetical protein
MVIKADLVLWFNHLDSVPAQAGHVQLLAAWRKLITLAVSRGGIMSSPIPPTWPKAGGPDEER